MLIGIVDMIPPYRTPLPYEEYPKKEELTGRVKSKTIKNGRSSIDELWVEAVVSGYRQYYWYSQKRNSTEPYSKTIWRKAKDEEIDELIIGDKLIPVL